MEKATMMNGLLSVDNLEAGVREHGIYRPVLGGVSFSVEAGKTLGIVGESGSGKSFTAMCIMGLLQPGVTELSNGSIRFSPRPGEVIQLESAPEKVYRQIRGNRISMIFQEPMTSLNPVHTCGRQVAEIIQIHRNITFKEAREEVLYLFERVKLPRIQEMFQAYPHQLSGGQKQRVMIAMAVANKPSLLIADEPTTALDVTVQHSVLNLMLELQQEYQMGMIFITHDLGVVKQVAHDVLVMQNGKVIETGSSQAIFHHPEQVYTKGLIACKPGLHQRPSVLPTVEEFIKNEQVPEVHMVSSAERTARLEKIYRQEPLLRIRDLHTHFPASRNFFGTVTSYTEAVKGLDFEVYPGETFGLVGESGCGKSTLGRSILRLTEPWKGQVLYHGKDILKLNPQELRKHRRKMQIIFQDPYSSLNPRLTVGEFLTEPLRVHMPEINAKNRKQKVLDLLAKVGLGDQHYNRYPHEFSGGQRQRIGIARTLILEPEFIICDESVSALDVSVQAQVLNLLNELKAAFHLTYIFISHDLSVVKYMCDRIMVMQKGRMVELEDADRLVSHPKEEYTRQLIDAIPVMD